MAQSKSIGAQIDELHGIREQLRSIENAKKVLLKRKEQAEYDLMGSLEAQDLESGRGNTATATIQRTTLPSVSDWDEFYKFIADNDAFYLLERRPAAVAYRELLEAREGEAIPGVEPFERTAVLLRTL